jgi:predicted homoserine dehydrogenase-like protein
VRLDGSGTYAALHRSSHLIGLELAVSVVRAGLRGEATGTSRGWHAEAVARAKRDLAPGDVLDGEGGFCAHGVLMAATARVRRTHCRSASRPVRSSSNRSRRAT